MSVTPTYAPMLQQSVQWGENYVSRALNMKLAGIIKPGIYSGFVLHPAGVMTVQVEHDPGESRSVAVVEREGFSITVIMTDPGLVEIPAKGVWHICVEACYLPNQQGYQRIVAREYPEPHHVILGKVIADTDGSLTTPLRPEDILTEDENRTDTGMATQADLNRVLKILSELTNQIVRISHRVTTLELRHSVGIDPGGGSSGPGEGSSAGSVTTPNGTVIGLARVGTDPNELGDAPLMFVLGDNSPVIIPPQPDKE